MIGTKTEALLNKAPEPSPSALVLGTETITPNSQGQYVIHSQTLMPGSAITVSGTAVSSAPGGAQAFVGSSVEQLAQTSANGVVSAGAGNNSWSQNASLAFTGGARKLRVSFVVIGMVTAVVLVVVEMIA